MTPLLERLREEEDISILTLPAAAYFPISFMKGNQVTSDAETLYSFLLLHCREMNNRFLIIDPPMGLHGEYLQNWVERFRTSNSKTSSYGALYYPWLWERDKGLSTIIINGWCVCACRFGASSNRHSLATGKCSYSRCDPS